MEKPPYLPDSRFKGDVASLPSQVEKLNLGLTDHESSVEKMKACTELFSMAPYLVDAGLCWRSLNTVIEEMDRSQPAQLNGIDYKSDHDEKNDLFGVRELHRALQTAPPAVKTAIVSLVEKWSADLSMHKLVTLALMIHGDEEPWQIMEILDATEAYWATDHDQFIKRLKLASEIIRKTMSLPSGKELTVKRVAALAYLEFSSGRVESRYDPEKEVANRSEETISLVYPNEQGNCEFKKEDLDKRVTWPADGATRETWAWKQRNDYKHVKLNRKAAMEALNAQEFWDLLEIEIAAIAKNPEMRSEAGPDEPVLEGVAADKFENAKGRLLAAGDNRSHTIQHLIAHRFEAALQSDELFGHPRSEGDAYKHLAAFFEHFARADIENRQVFAGSLDWADFNTHLRPKHMCATLRAIGKRVAKDTKTSEDLETLNKLLDRECRAIMNQHLTARSRSLSEQSSRPARDTQELLRAVGRVNRRGTAVMEDPFP
eukprot:Skav235338  [mRNA]  locus=scaffold520:835817:838874:+ [translate_table: standard]